MLKKIYIEICRNPLSAEALAVFSASMESAGIQVKSCKKADVNFDDPEAMLITDRILAAGTGRATLVGYGDGYAGRLNHIVTDLNGITPQYMKLLHAHEQGEPADIADTGRLLIREMAVRDLPDVYRLYDTLAGCPFVEALYPWDKELEFTENYIKNMYGFYQYGLWLVFEKETRRLVGRAGIENRVIDGVQRQELGYLVGKPWQRKGYAMEMASAIMKYAFCELELDEIFICTCKENKPSVSLAKKLGFSSYADDVDGMNLYIYRPNA